MPEEQQHGREARLELFPLDPKFRSLPVAVLIIAEFRTVLATREARQILRSQNYDMLVKLCRWRYCDRYKNIVYIVSNYTM